MSPPHGLLCYLPTRYMYCISTQSSSQHRQGYGGSMLAGLGTWFVLNGHREVDGKERADSAEEEVATGD